MLSFHYIVKKFSIDAIFQAASENREIVRAERER